jgi:hypothetical protein
MMVGLGLTSAVISASERQVATLDERIDGAARVVVATARTVTGSWRENSHGDRIIVSRVLLDVEETLKGAEAATAWLDVDGGTLDGLTLQVSSLPDVRPGERAVFFLAAPAGNVHTPFLRGQGILKLEDDGLVRGTSLHLNEIRSRALRVRQ